VKLIAKSKTAPPIASPITFPIIVTGIRKAAATTIMIPRRRIKNMN